MKAAISYGTFMGWLTNGVPPYTVKWFKDKGYWFASVYGPFTVEECNYRAGLRKPNYPVPAIRHYLSWGNDKSHVTIWENVIQWRISDQPYTGFGMVITVEHGVRCETRYDDFD